MIYDMKLQNLAISISASLLIGSFVYYGYSNNMLNSKQIVVANTRRTSSIIDVGTKDINISSIRQDITSNNVKDANKLGVIAIPDLDIFLPIYDKPYDPNILLEGSNLLRSTQNNRSSNVSIGDGNTILVAHNYNDGRTMFSPLQQNINQNQQYLKDGKPIHNYWLSGKKIYIASHTSIFVYTIEVQKTIHESDLTIKKETSDPVVNIITCLEPNDSYRIVTHGRLIEKYSWFNAPLDIINLFDKSKFPYNLKG